MVFFWAIVYLILAGVSALIVEKRGRSGGKFFFKLVSGTAVLLLVAIWALDGSYDSDLGVWIVAYTCLGLGFLVAIFNPGAKELATTAGEHGEYKKCRYCAEPVRKEAVKCKHCQSDLQPAAQQ